MPREPIFFASDLGVYTMDSKEIPLQSEPCIQKRFERADCSSLVCADAPLHRRRLLQLLGAGALGLALPVAGQSAGLAATAPPEERESSPEPFWQPAGMDVLTAIFTRRTQREYTGEPVSKETVQRILAAGMNAPSAHNTQPWSFVVFTSQDSLNRIPKLIPYTQYAVKAGAAVLVCVRFLEGEVRELAPLSVACCVQNMLLTSHVLGYGSVWIQIYPNTELVNAWRKEVKIPDEVLPLAVMPIGRPVSPLPPVNRMDPAKIHYENWQKS